MRRVDVHVRTPRSSHRVRTTHAPNNVLSIESHLLAEWSVVYEQIARGRVDVHWQVDGDVFEMSWVERNGPPVRAPDRRGFGSTVIEAMAKRAVDGEVQLEYDPAGVAWHLTCPAANALER